MPQLIIIVEKNGDLKTYNIKNELNEEELYKKAGYKKKDGFIKQTEWNVKLDGQKYIVSMYGKLDGKATTENKYDFPPPIDNKLYYGNCLLVGYIKEESVNKPISLTLSIWEKIYEKLFGGFEDLALCVLDDEEEEDELENIPKSQKTKKGGYLKDGFVIDSDEDEENSEYETENDSFDEQEEQNLETEELIIDEIGSELSEEIYDYSDDEE
jgi:hypothetical protein